MQEEPEIHEPDPVGDDDEAEIHFPDPVGDDADDDDEE